MNRGSSSRPVANAKPILGFNEAPIHESGKYRRHDPPSDPSGRFNEAPIHESGKWYRFCRDVLTAALLQ